MDYDPPFPDLASSPWKTSKSIQSAARRAPAKQLYKWKQIVAHAPIREKREKQPWYNAAAERFTSVDIQLREFDQAVALLRRKSKGKKRGRHEAEEEEVLEEGEKEEYALAPDSEEESKQ
jgi:hypothetical protein